MTQQIIKAVLFDLGETLLSFGKVNSVELFKEAGRFSYDFLCETGQPIGGFRIYLWKSILQLRIKYFLSGLFGNDFDSLALMKKDGEKNGFTLTDRQYEHLNGLWYEPLKQRASIEPNLAETLSKLQQLGLRLGILSNTFVSAYALEKHLGEEGLLDVFDVRLYSYQFDFRKPDKRIFLEAAKRIGQSPENILFAGDRLDTDIKGALNVGMLPVLKKAYTNENKKTPNGVMKIETISQLPEIIKKHNHQNT